MELILSVIPAMQHAAGQKGGCENIAQILVSILATVILLSIAFATMTVTRKIATKKFGDTTAEFISVIMVCITVFTIIVGVQTIAMGHLPWNC